MDEIRESFVNQGVSFLKNTASTPVSKRIGFLEQKGLSHREIVESMRRAETHPTFISPTLPQTNLPPGMTTSGIISTAIAVLGVGFLVYSLSNSLESLGNDGLMLSQDDLTTNDQAINGDESRNDTTTTTTASRGQNSAVAVTEELSRIATAMERHADAIESLRRERKEEKEPQWAQNLTKLTEVMRESMLAMQTQLATYSGGASPASSIEGAHANSAQRITALVKAAAALGRGDKTGEGEGEGEGERGTVSEKVLRTGCEAIKMYLTNILEHIDVPRYRKIATANQNFKSLVVPLVGHATFLQAAGFLHKESSSRGSSSSFEWVPGDDGDTLLREGVRLLNCLLAGTALDPQASTPVPPPTAPLPATAAEQRPLPDFKQIQARVAKPVQSQSPSQSLVTTSRTKSKSVVASDTDVTGKGDDPGDARLKDVVVVDNDNGDNLCES